MKPNLDVLRSEIRVAVIEAIKAVGVSVFKRTSFFGSNEKTEESKKAA